MPKERINIIRDILIKEKRIVISELSSRFNVSAVTIRKDISLLEKEGILNKTYGGAVFLPEESKVHLSAKDDVIIKTALGCINEGDTIFLGSGKTCCHLAQQLGHIKNLSVITNNISAVQDLLNNVSTVFLIGGEVASVDNATIFSSIRDPLAYLKDIYINKSFTSASGIDLKAGITVSSIISTYLYRCIPKIENKWHLMAQKSKFDQRGIYKVADLSQIDFLISDYVPAKYKDELKKNNVTILSPE